MRTLYYEQYPPVVDMLQSDEGKKTIMLTKNKSELDIKINSNDLCNTEEASHLINSLNDKNGFMSKTVKHDRNYLDLDK